MESHRHKHTLVDGRNDLGSFEKVLQLPNTEVSHTNRLHQTLCYYGLHSLGGGVVQGTQEGGTAVILVTQYHSYEEGGGGAYHCEIVCLQVEL